MFTRILVEKERQSRDLHLFCGKSEASTIVRGRRLLANRDRADHGVAAVDEGIVERRILDGTVAHAPDLDSVAHLVLRAQFVRIGRRVDGAVHRPLSHLIAPVPDVAGAHEQRQESKHDAQGDPELDVAIGDGPHLCVLATGRTVTPKTGALGGRSHIVVAITGSSSSSTHGERTILLLLVPLERFGGAPCAAGRHARVRARAHGAVARGERRLALGPRCQQYHGKEHPPMIHPVSFPTVYR